MSDAVRGSPIPTILCVDDEPCVLRALVRVFRSEPVRVLTASGGPEGLAILRRESVQLIVTDYRMPAMTGVQFLEQAHALCPDVFRILLTGFADIAAVTEAINRGQIYKILYKPWNDGDLKLTVRSALEHYAQSQHNRMLQRELEQQNALLQKLMRRLEANLEDKTSELSLYAGTLLTAQRLLDCLPCAVIGVDESGQIVLANQTAEVWFGQAAQPCPASPLLGAWAKERLPAPVGELVARVLEEGRSSPLPHQIELSLHEERTVLVSCRLIEAADSQGVMVPAGVLLHAGETNAGAPSRCPT